MIVWNGRVAGASAFGWPGTCAEAGGAVLEHDPRSRRDDAGAERAVDALDQRHRHAVAVDGAEVGRPAAGRLDAEIDRPLRPDERPARGEPLVREEVGGQRAVVHERVRVGERELHRLDLGVQPRLEAVVEREREERRDALAVRRQLAHLDSRGRRGATARPTPSGGRARSSSESQVAAAIAAATSPLYSASGPSAAIRRSVSASSGSA